jgi:hypothetical protein
MKAKTRRNFRRRVLNPRHGHRWGWSERLKEDDARNQQWLLGEAVLKERQLGQHWRMAVARLKAARRRRLFPVVRGTHRCAPGMRNTCGPGVAGIGEPDKKREQPRTQNQGRKRFAMTAQGHKKSTITPSSVGIPAAAPLTRINGVLWPQSEADADLVK